MTMGEGCFPTDKEVIQMFDDALDRGSERAFEKALGSLRAWALHKVVLPRVKNWSDAEDLTQEAIIKVWRVAQVRQLTGEEIVGLAHSTLFGWKNKDGKQIPSLITKHQADLNQQRQKKVSTSQPLPDTNSESGDSGLTVGDTIADTAPTPEEELLKKEEGNLRTARVAAQIEEWERRIPDVRGEKRRETLQAILEFVKAQRGKSEDVDFKAPVLHSKRLWKVSPTVLDWYKSKLNLTQDGAVRNRLLSVRDLLCRFGLDKPSGGVRELREDIAALRAEAKRLWNEPKDKKTVQVLCDWFEEELKARADSDLVTLEPPLFSEQGQSLLDEALSEYLQSKWGMPQNSVRKRVDRAFKILEEWGFVGR